MFNPEPLGQFQQIWHKALLDEGDASLFEWRATTLNNDNKKIDKI